MRSSFTEVYSEYTNTFWGDLLGKHLAESLAAHQYDGSGA